MTPSAKAGERVQRATAKRSHGVRWRVPPADGNAAASVPLPYVLRRSVGCCPRGADRTLPCVVQVRLRLIHRDRRATSVIPITEWMPREDPAVAMRSLDDCEQRCPVRRRLNLPRLPRDRIQASATDAHCHCPSQGFVFALVRAPT
jgi:hypothetical protein